MMSSSKQRYWMAGVLAVIASASFARAVAGESGRNPPSEDQIFSITIDPSMWGRWDFQYPATYIFEIRGLSPGTEVNRREHPTLPWTTLPKRAAGDIPNGVSCVRFDFANERAFVSVGFGAGNSFELKFARVASARFLSIARYYDDRKAAYTLSLDNWGRQASANPGAEWDGPEGDRSDKYQAALEVCRGFGLPVSIAINSQMAGSNAMWRTMQQELDRGDFSWEPAVHARGHPGKASAYDVNGRDSEILGCRDDIRRNLTHIPFGGHIFEHILTSGYQDEAILCTEAGEFLFVRGYNGRDNSTSTTYETWDDAHKFYVGGLTTKAYDRVFARREPKGRYFGADVAELNAAFDRTVDGGCIFNAMWHPDRYQNSVLHDRRPGEDGVRGSTLIQHLSHIARRKDIWCVPNGWLYCYRYVAEHAEVTELPSRIPKRP